MQNGNGAELCIDVDALAKYLKTSITDMNLIEAECKSGKGKRPLIPMVPKLLRGGESNAFEPKILSLGPYHHHKPHLQAMKPLKLLYLGRFLDRNKNISLRQYLEQVKEREREARMAYAEDCNMTSHDFVEMLLLDCCFVLEMANDIEGVDKCNIYIYRSFVSMRYSSLVMMEDMLQLENQLPFFLIRHLFDSVRSSMAVKSLEELLTNFFQKLVHSAMKIPSIGCGNDGSSNNGHSGTPNAPESSRDFLHILHLVHSSLCPQTMRQRKTRKGACCHLRSRHPKFTLSWIPCATELNNAGILFVAKEEKEWLSETRLYSFFDITFEEGRMKIPKLLVDHVTETILHNLIAFEQYCAEAKMHVSSYASLLNSIINTEAEVELLQQSGVLVNCLGDNKEVAILFNKLGKEAILFNKLGKEAILISEYYYEVYKDVQRHCNIDCNKWRAKLNHDYFSNPWAIISLVAAFFLFLLPITQTVFSVLSYVKPKQS